MIGFDPSKIVTVKYKDLELIGANTIVGMTVKALGAIPDKLTLRFPKPTTGWLERNKGSNLLVVGSEIYACLAEDLIFLTKSGCDITIVVYEEDPP